MTPERKALEYLVAMGLPRYVQQQRIARDFFVCCGERRTQGHHVTCGNRPKSEQAAHVDGQQKLL